MNDSKYSRLTFRASRWTPTLAMPSMIAAIAAASCASVAADEKSDPGYQQPFVTQANVDGQGDDDFLHTEDFSLATFTYHNAEHRVFISRRFLVDKGNLVHLDAQDRATFGNYQFYLYPFLSVDESSLMEATQQMVPLSPANEGSPQYSTTLHVSLVTDGLREAAAAAVRARYPGADVKKENIALHPYRYIELRGDLGQGEVVLTALPSYGGLAMPKLANIPNNLEVPLVGTKEELIAFLKRPVVRGRFIGGGYVVKTNMVNFGLSRIVQSGLHHFLTGDARWSDLHTVRLDREVDGEKQMVAEQKKETTNWVTRWQMKELSTKVAVYVGGVAFKEFEEGTDVNQLTKQIMDQLLADAAEEQTWNVFKHGEQWIVDEKLSRDISPDRFQAINAELNEIVTKHLKERNAESEESGDPEKVEKEASESEVEHETLDEHGIVWSEKGSLIVPKSIRLHQFNSSKFHAYKNISYASIQARKATGTIEMPMSIGPYGVQLTINHLRFVNVWDDDEDLKHFGMKVTCFDVDGNEIPGTAWNLTRGLTENVGDRDRGPFKPMQGAGEDAELATDFFINESCRVNHRVASIKVQAWAETDDGDPTIPWQPFEQVFQVRNGQFEMIGGGPGGKPVDAYNGRSIQVSFTMQQL